MNDQIRPRTQAEMEPRIAGDAEDEADEIALQPGADNAKATQELLEQL